MGLLIGVGDYGIGDMIAKAEALYNLLLDLCGDQLAWENILNRPTTRDGYELTDVSTTAEIAQMLTGYALANHTHSWGQITGKPELYTKSEVYNKEEIDEMIGESVDILPIEISDVTGLADALLKLNFQLVNDIPASPASNTIYTVKQGSKFLLYVTDNTGAALSLDAVTSTQLSNAIQTRQPKLNGTNEQVTLGDGTFAPFNKEAIGLGQVPNLPPAQWPLSNAAIQALALKANDDEVLKKNGNQTVQTGVITFNESPLVPTPEQTGDAANKGYVDQAIGNSTGQISFEFENTETWIVPHNLNGQPVPLIVINGFKVESDVEFLDNDVIRITHSKPETGIVYINRF